MGVFVRLSFLLVQVQLGDVGVIGFAEQGQIGRIAVDTDLAGLDEELDAGARGVGESLGEVLVETEVVGGGVGKERADGQSSNFRLGLPSEHG